MSLTTIEWCARPGTIPETWNPTTGCNKVSRGCKFCYAEIMHRRLQAMGQAKYQQPFLAGAVEQDDYSLLTLPLSWKKPRTVFVNSMSDLFHKNISFGFIDKLFAVMALATDHTFIICTKRADIMYEYFNAGKEALIDRWSRAALYIGYKENKPLYKDKDYAVAWIGNVIPQRWPLPNVWLLTSTEDQSAFNDRHTYLLNTPAAVIGLSCEPLVGRLDISPFLNKLNGRSAWVICGGESGHKASPMHPDWARSLRDQCLDTNTPFFFKQWGEWMPDRACKTAEDYDSIPAAKTVQLIDGHGKHDSEILLKKDWPVRYRVLKVGKHQSGRLLDGKEHNEFPVVNPIDQL